MASEAGSAATPETAVVVAVRGDVGRCRRAVRWAAEYLVPRADRVVLLHVIPRINSIPSPSGGRVPIDRLDKGLVDLYVQDVKLKVQEVFFQLKNLCGTKKVETLVLEGEDKANALLKYISDSGIKNLVLGSSSSWIRRVLKVPDVSAAVLKSAPSSCSIFIVSRRKLTIQLAKDLVSSDTNTSARIEVISHKMFAHKWNTIFDGGNVSYNSLGGGNLSCNSECTDASSNSHVLILRLKKEGRLSSEVLKLRIELQSVLALCNKADNDLIHAKEKVHLLSAECFEEAKKVKDAFEREEIFKAVAAEERAKYLEAHEELEKARIFLAEKALDRHEEETHIGKLSCEKPELLDALLLSDKRCRSYSKKEIEIATDNYSDAKKIGEGGYGFVYKCDLDHNPVAVKVLKQDTKNKREEYLREVEILSQLRHPNIVALLGVCPETGCLIYEYMENRSLEDLLFYRNEKNALSWFVRFRILFEVACGLGFLHDIKPEPIVHRDMKPGNILLDRNYVSKIGDVGLAKVLSDVVPDGLTEYNETTLAGTLYYMDPEYQRTGTIRPKSDVYALGLIALQLLTGRRPKGLIVTVKNAVKRGFLPKVLDKSISDWPLVEADRLAKLALKCCRLRCRDRPDLMSEILPELEQLMNLANICIKLDRCNVCAPSHFLCPILQEIMEDPYIAADGYTYEHRAIKAWLERSTVSPITKIEFLHSSIVANQSLRAAIQKWKSETKSLLN